MYMEHDEVVWNKIVVTKPNKTNLSATEPSVPIDVMDM